jgi:hypothetical protein
VAHPTLRPVLGGPLRPPPRPWHPRLPGDGGRQPRRPDGNAHLRGKVVPDRVGPAASHEGRCSWDVLPRYPPGAIIHSGQTPLYMAGMESAGRSPVTPSAGSSSTSRPNLSPPLPQLYRDMGMVVMPMKGYHGPTYCADTSVPGRGRRQRSRSPGVRSRTAGSHAPTTAPLLRYLDPPRSRLDHVRLESDDRDLRAT